MKTLNQIEFKAGQRMPIAFKPSCHPDGPTFDANNLLPAEIREILPDGRVYVVWDNTWSVVAKPEWLVVEHTANEELIHTQSKYRIMSNGLRFRIEFRYKKNTQVRQTWLGRLFGKNFYAPNQSVCWGPLEISVNDVVYVLGTYANYEVAETALVTLLKTNTKSDLIKAKSDLIKARWEQVA